MKHVPGCSHIMTTAEESIRRWKEKWPNACSSCNGAGGFLLGEDLPTPAFEGCDECLGNGKCPRCSTRFPEELISSYEDGGNPQCPSCGWNWGIEDRADIQPTRPECWGCGQTEQILLMEYEDSSSIPF